MQLALTIVLFFSSFSLCFSAADISVTRKKLLYEGKITEAKKELLSLYSSANVRDKKEILSLLGEYTNTPYRTLFKMCKSQNMDCSYYKAKILEQQGNAGSAMELYKDAGYTDDYIRLQAYSGQTLSTQASEYYQAVLYMGKGEWDKAINLLSDKIFRNNAKATFYLGYAFLMKGENQKARALLEKQPDGINFFEKLEYKRLLALMLYAENKQFESMDILQEILKYMPGDLLSKRYVAHIYYRTGWFYKAEQIYLELIKKEWRDTELYYLLSERCEMRVRNLRFELAKSDAQKIIKEYPQRKDYIADLVSLLLTYGNIDDAVYFASKLSTNGDAYEQGLRYFTEGLILDFKQESEPALDMFKKALVVFPSKEYSKKVEEANENLKQTGKGKEQRPSCEYLQKYHIRSDPNGSIRVVLPIKFVYDKGRIYFGEKEKLWKNNIQKVWSVYGIKLELIDGDLNRIELVPWPSSFYLKRVSSHEWSILTPPSVIVHEVGHLLGLEDEYYEHDPRLSSRNEGRFIGPVDSIMRNMWNGKPEKRHIHFILSPLKCN